MRKQYPISSARDQLPRLIHSVEAGPPVELTRRGRPVAVLVSVDEFDRLSRKKPDLWESIQRFRAETDLEALDIEDVYTGIRDRSPGREPEL